jgi:hypothetical protein
MFLRWDNDNFSSAHELWEVKTDLTTGALLEEPRRVTAVPGDSNSTLLGLSVTVTGKQAMVLVQAYQNSVFVGDFDQPPPRISNTRRLTLDDQTNYPHAWTADSRTVIFESNRNGGYDLFKQAIDQRTPKVIVATPMTEVLPQLGPDGHFLLYAMRPPQKPAYYKVGMYKLMRVPVEGRHRKFPLMDRWMSFAARWVLASAAF